MNDDKTKQKKRKYTQEVREYEPNETAMMLSLINNLAFITEYQKSPEDALLSFRIPNSERFYKAWSDSNYKKMVERAAEITGGSIEQISNKSTRTAEQAEALMRAAAEEQVARMDAFLNSNYAQAIEELEKVQGTYNDPEPKGDYTIKELATLYFFAIHWDNDKIIPTHTRSLTDEHLKELKAVFERLDAYYAEQSKDTKRERSQIFIDFIRQYTEKPNEALKLLPRIITKPPEVVEYPLDKVNSGIWKDLSASMDEDGNISFATERKGSKKQATVIYSIDFDELIEDEGVKISKVLTSFDKRVLLAVNAIYSNGASYMSIGQIFTAMGNKGNPSKDQVERIFKSLIKMGSARIILDNSKEIGVNKKTAKFFYEGPLIPFEQEGAIINNTFVESAIHLFRDIPVIKFAKGRNQLTTINRKLLESPANKTDENLRIEDYLIWRISRMKNGSEKTRKILYSKIFEKCQIETAKQKKRAPEKIKRYLDHYIQCRWIKGYTESQDGLSITL